MPNINVSPSSDQTSNIFQLANFVNAEAVTSAKLNVFSQQINNEFGVLSEVVGNSFIHGLPNLSATVGNLKKLTQPVVNSNSFIGVKPVLFNGSNTLLNEMPATVGSINGSGQYPITITGGGVIGAQNIIGSSGSVPIINIAIAQKDGNGNIVTIYPGSFLTNVGYAGGTVSQFLGAFGDVITPGNNFYVLAANFSVIDVLTQAVTNMGDMAFARSTGYVDSSDNIQSTLGGVPTVTAEVNSTENKTFAVKWHAVLSMPGTISGSNTIWTTTASATTFQAGSSPSPASVKSYISNLGAALVIPANTNVGMYVSANNAPVISGGSLVSLNTPMYDGTTLTISIPTAALANVTTSTIDVYFPALVPVRLLQSNNLNYTDEHTRVVDLFKTVIGSQYAWTQASYPGTIANRLDGDEAAINALSTTVTSLGGATVPNGSFEVATDGIHPDKWNIVALSGGSFALDSTSSNFIHGAQSIKFTVGTQGLTFGGGYAESLDFIPTSIINSIFLKWKVKSSAANLSNKAEIEFYNAAKTLVGSFTIWDNGGTSTTSWATQYGSVLATAIPANTFFMKVKLTGGYLNSQLGSTWFDDVAFFVPAHSNAFIKYTPGTYSFITPSNCVSIDVDLLSAGGGGGGDNFGSPAGGGGGSGAYSLLRIAVIPETTYTINSGSGGFGGGHDSSGGDGGASSFGTYSVPGGQGGRGGNLGGAGGTGAVSFSILPTVTSGAIVLKSSFGSNGAAHSGTTGGVGGSLSLVGGATTFNGGAGGAGGSGTGAGVAGGTYGGGGGGNNGNNAATLGGVGGDGIVIVYY